MAKRKLSPEQRESIRKHLEKEIAAKKKRSEVLVSTAKKYGISAESVRWYLKNVSTTAGKGKPRRKPEKAARRGRLTGRQAKPRNGILVKLVQGVEKAAVQTIARARAAKRLIPRWQAHIRRQLSLKRLKTRVVRELRSVSAKAKSLHREIARLAAR